MKYWYFTYSFLIHDGFGINGSGIIQDESSFPHFPINLIMKDLIDRAPHNYDKKFRPRIEFFSEISMDDFIKFSEETPNQYEYDKDVNGINR